MDSEPSKKWEIITPFGQMQKQSQRNCVYMSQVRMPVMFLLDDLDKCGQKICSPIFIAQLICAKCVENAIKTARCVK